MDIRYIFIVTFGKNQFKSMSMNMSGELNVLDEVK